MSKQSERYFPQPSVMTAQQHFSAVPQADIQRSRFDRSHSYKSTFNAGMLIPVFIDEALPGDTFHMKGTCFTRLATPLKPIMDNVQQDMHFFFVPNRLVWDHWAEFMGERKSPHDDPNDYSMPQNTWNPHAALTHATGADFAVGDYLGLPKVDAVNETHNVSALPLRAIQLIWNEWYRDENLQDPIALETGNSGDTMTYNAAVSNFPRGKRKDYFTSCLPWPQKGDAVTVPLGAHAPLGGTGTVLVDRFTNSVTSGDQAILSQKQTTAGQLFGHDAVPSGTPGNWFATEFHGIVDTSAMYADLAAATAVSINDLRSAFQIQRMLERDARGGTRYIELILSHFGVQNPDFRLQRPEYLGGGTTNVNINPVASTYTSIGNAPQGNLSATGTSILSGSWSHSFTEHGFVIGFVSVRADLTYQRGVERFWSRLTRNEHYWPTLAHLGEQAVLNKEIWLGTSASGHNDEVFGYQERFGEYRYKPSRITGLFASEEAQSLDVWHLSQDFSALPVLNDSFIKENPPIDRIVAVQTQPHFLADFWFDLKCDRPMPVFSVPGLIDHF